LHGFRDAEHYYQSCSGLNFLPAVQCPLLLIHAQDDPFLAPAVIPQHLPPQVQLHLSRHGGHVGFLSGTPWRPEYWLEQVIPQWFGTNSSQQEQI
jgi:predicted alpha/beta-fold hydrolase